jgi:hypothetical protein
MYNCIRKVGSHLNSKLWNQTAIMFYEYSSYLSSLYMLNNEAYTRLLQGKFDTERKKAAVKSDR